jgi:protein phosphatase PTC7
VTGARHVESEGVQGSCTACVLTINKDTGRLQAATLGDSGFLIVGPRAPMHGDLQVRFCVVVVVVVCLVDACSFSTAPQPPTLTNCTPPPPAHPHHAQLMVKFRTAQLEHEFGCPYQLGHHTYANRPTDADLAAMPVAAGDVVVMGSDGLLDNLSETEIVAEVSRLVAEGARPAAMAQRIAKVGCTGCRRADAVVEGCRDTMRAHAGLYTIDARSHALVCS